MNQIYVVIGANFGDEGKGLITDFLCESVQGKVLNVRFNGGAQAGHTVVKSDGRRHIFRHFGSGSFNKNVTTYLSSEFILNPIAFNAELIELKALGVDPKVMVHRKCRVTLPSDIMINQIVELSRGENRHGSCGYGIWETVRRNADHFSLTIEDMLKETDLKKVLKGIVHNYVYTRLKDLGVGQIPEDYKKYLVDEKILKVYIDNLKQMVSSISLTDDDILGDYQSAVFEGAQGLLLDWGHRDYFPYLTASYTGLKNVMPLIAQYPKCNMNIYYVTRSYFTRHGAGPLETECESTWINPKGLVDRTNQTNLYQGHFRYGYFDLELFKRTLDKDIEHLQGRGNTKVRLAVTHLDETKGQIVTKGGRISLKNFEEQVGHRVGLLSNDERSSKVIPYDLFSNAG